MKFKNIIKIINFIIISDVIFEHNSVFENIDDLLSTLTNEVYNTQSDCGKFYFIENNHQNYL